MYPAGAGPVGIGYSYRSYAVAGITFHFPYIRASGYSAGTTVIIAIAGTAIIIVDNGGIVDDRYVTAIVDIVVVDLPAADISSGNESPVGSRHIVG